MYPFRISTFWFALLVFLTACFGGTASHAQLVRQGVGPAQAGGLQTGGVRVGGAGWQSQELTWKNYMLVQLEHNRELQQELEIADYQIEQLKEIREATKAQERELSANYREQLRSGSRPEAQQQYMKTLQELRKDSIEQCEEVFLDHQRKRLNQVVQQQLAQYSNGGFAANQRTSINPNSLNFALNFARQLELSPEEAEALREKVEEERAALLEEYRRLEAKALERILESLPADKRRELREIAGEPYDFAAAQQSIQESYREANRRRIEQQQADREKKEEQSEGNSTDDDQN